MAPTRVHAIVAIVVAWALPASSRLCNAGWFSWTMYSSSASYRLRIRAIDASGDARPLAPTALALASGRIEGNYLAGSEHWRFAPAGASLRRSLPSLVALACDVSRAAQVEIDLDERNDLDAPVSVTSAHAVCIR